MRKQKENEAVACNSHYREGHKREAIRRGKEKVWEGVNGGRVEGNVIGGKIEGAFREEMFKPR